MLCKGHHTDIMRALVPAEEAQTIGLTRGHEPHEIPATLLLVSIISGCRPLPVALRGEAVGESLGGGDIH
jgi:hypothetical protein